MAVAEDFDLVRLEFPELPIFLAVARPLADGVTGDRPRLPAGRGLTPNDALIAAGAEALELRASLARNHPRSQRRDREGVERVEARDLLSHETAMLPARQVFLDHPQALGKGPPVGADSTGCAAGNTYAEACRGGLLECIERDAVALWWHGRQRRAAWPVELIDAIAPRLAWWLETRPRRTVLLDVSQDSGVPVVAAFSTSPDGRHVALGSAARFIAAEAAVAAVTEMIQTEVSLALALEAGDDEARRWLEAASVHRMPQLQPDSAAKPKPYIVADTAQALHNLAASGHRVLAVNLTLPGDPLESVRIIVGGYCALGGQIDAARFHRIIGGPPQPSAGAFLEPY
ncbi:MAG: YcaO-like family protein [Aestuariivirga sp.]|uniref:YcaO-like family protein n=1 Tax=Aestuariivirga sp. TaxID=2650926 RepID=UPI0038D1071D